MRRIAALAATFAVFGVFASPVAAATKTISWGFGTTGTISVKKGTTVKWSWTGGPHNVVGSGFTSGSPKSSGSYSRTFSKAGSYSVYCAPHQAVMNVTIKVS
jgi:plastocyanin